MVMRVEATWPRELTLPIALELRTEELLDFYKCHWTEGNQVQKEEEEGHDERKTQREKEKPHSQRAEELWCFYKLRGAYTGK